MYFAARLAFSAFVPPPDEKDVPQFSDKHTAIFMDHLKTRDGRSYTFREACRDMTTASILYNIAEYAAESRLLGLVHVQSFNNMNASRLTYLVFGATGGTGKHFVAKALSDGHNVRALVRTPNKVAQQPNLEIIQGSFTDVNLDCNPLVNGVDAVVLMVGERETQKTRMICLELIKKLVPAMRQHKVKKILFQAGGLSKPYGGELSWLLWILRYTIARAFDGQHKDNEAVMEYLATQAMDLDWIVHRAGIGSDGASKGTLKRSATSFSIANHQDCAEYNYRILSDAEAVHTSDFSTYNTQRGGKFAPIG